MDHILVIDLGDIDLPDWPTQECTSTFTRQIDCARVVLRESQPSLVLMSVEEDTAETMNFIEEALETGARVVVVGPPDDEHDEHEEKSRIIRHANLTYVTKPLEAEALSAIVAQQSFPEAPVPKRVHIHKPTKPVVLFGTLPSQCDAMRDILDQILRVASTSVTVLLTGESGTGKEVAAQAIHRQSHRKDKPFVPINCGAISSQLIESELFGHEKGSFTGAVREHRGVFEQAQGGTLFLDEITEMPVDLQVKLLRVLETHKFFRLGSDREQATDVRIIAATNRVPEREVEEGRFRADLLYRLQVFPMYLPPLRQREGDVQLLAEHFLAELNAVEGTSKTFSSEVLPALAKYSWPGNLRELKNVVQRSYIMADQVITTRELPGDIVGSDESRHQSGSSLTVRVGMSVAEVEENLIVATLNQCEGKKEKAAGVLGVSVKTLYNRLREYEERTMHSPPSKELSAGDGQSLRERG